MPSSVDAAVAALAVPQCGAFSIAQAQCAGADYKTIHRRSTSGRWDRPLRAVLQLPGFPPDFRQRLWWAVLSGPSGTRVSHWAALALHQIEGFPPTRLTVCVPHGAHHSNPVATVFQSTIDVAPVLIDGLPVSPLPVALCEAARMVGPLRIGAAIDDADRSGRCRIELVRAEHLRRAAPGRVGSATMRRALALRADDAYVPPRPTLERALDAVLRRLPVTFEVEASLPGREWSLERVDRLCRSPRPLVIEGDGRRWHTRERDFVRDARRQRDALAAGFPTAHFTYRELIDHPDECERELREILGLPARRFES